VWVVVLLLPDLPDMAHYPEAAVRSPRRKGLVAGRG
jgi:hypothetical protein